MRQFRSIFISDVHLGTPECQAEYLLDFLRSTRSANLFLVGDIVDLEALRRRSHWPASHSAVLAEILAIAARGTRVTYLPGNHDAALHALCGQRIGAIAVAAHALHVGADGRVYRVAHGDEFERGELLRHWLNVLGERLHALLILVNRGANFVRRCFGYSYRPFTIAAKARIGRAIGYIRGFEADVAEHAREFGYDGHICGHIHYGNIRRFGDTLYLNDGDWVEHCTALVEHEDGAMELLHWVEHATALARVEGETVLPVVAFRNAA